VNNKDKLNKYSTRIERAIFKYPNNTYDENGKFIREVETTKLMKGTFTLDGWEGRKLHFLILQKKNMPLMVNLVRGG